MTIETMQTKLLDFCLFLFFFLLLVCFSSFLHFQTNLPLRLVSPLNV